MRTLLLLAAVLTLSSSAHAAKVLYEEKDGGVLIVRDQRLAQAIRASDARCDAYADARKKADAAPLSTRKRDQRERAYLERRAEHLLGSCVTADEAAKRALAATLGERADRVEKAGSFEDMVYLQLAQDVAGN